MCDKGDHIIFKIPVLTKTSKVGKTLPDLTFTQFNDSELCVVKCLRQYVKITSNLRVEDDNINRNWLILSLVKPHHPITTSTLARWLKFTINESGIDTSYFKAHSTRAAATSKAFQNGISCTEIMSQAKWSNESTFSRFYHKPVEPNRFQQAVLSR